MCLVKTAERIEVLFVVETVGAPRHAILIIIIIEVQIPLMQEGKGVGKFLSIFAHCITIQINVTKF